MRAFFEALPTLLEAARASSEVYEARPSAAWQRYSIPRGQESFGSSVTVLMVRISHQAKTVEIAFRGTENWDDMVQNMKADVTPDSHLGVSMHRGFQDLAHEAYDFLKREVLTPANAAYSFRLYGHSLGGAIASIVGMHLQQDGKKVAAIATFGAPRFTTNDGARRYQDLNSRTFRVVRCDDLVPFLPPPNLVGWSMGSYEATGTLFLLLARGQFDAVVNQDAERSFADQIRRELSGLANDRLVFGHRMKNYQEALQKPQGAFGSSGWHPAAYTAADAKQLCP